MKASSRLTIIGFIALAVLPAAAARGGEDGDEVRYFIPQLLGAQYTFVDQHQNPLRSPYSGPLSLRADGDTEQSHTFGAYLGVPITAHLQFYFDLEMFKGEGVSNATGMAGLTNGDVIRSGTVQLGKRPYVARRYLRYVIPLGDAVHTIERAQDQLPGSEADERLEFKVGKLAVSDDFDKNRYANSTRTHFMNWALFNDAAWDFAADTRGYTTGALVAYAAPAWALRYGVFQMPTEANGQSLEWPLTRARGEQVELTLQPQPQTWILRLLVFRNIARMGIYRDAIAAAQAAGTVPDIRADDANGRRKHGYAANAEFPLADDGNTGLFARLGWNDGRTESFAFTEADRTQSVGLQLSGAHWSRPDDHFAIALVQNGLSHDHRDYLALGGIGFVLGDGALTYAKESILEAYYLLHVVAHVDVSPDFQFARAPGYNHDRGPARFLGLRVHLEM